MSARGDTFALCGTLVEGKLRIEQVVGEGGFGVVYRGVHEGFDAPIALKCLKLPPHFDRQAQDDLVRGLREEGRLLLRLSQRTPGIVQALDVGSFVAPTGARVPYLVLEWLEGRTLAADIKARIERGAPGRSLKEAMALLEPAARALAVAHQEKIAHRDIKPENLFLVQDGDGSSIKILDFGIAKVFADAPVPSGQVTGGVAAFTPSYGAPEQFEQKRGASGPWTDVFAFALVLVEVVTQKRALAGEDLAVLYSAAADPQRRPTLKAHGLESSPAVEQVLARAFAVDPAERYREIKAFWDALSVAVAEAGDVAAGGASAVGAFDRTELRSGNAFDQTELVSSATKQRTEVAPAIKIPEPPPPSDLPPKRGLAGPLAVAAGVVAIGVFGASRLLGPQGAEPPPPSPSVSGSPSAAASGLPRKPLPAPVDAACREAERAWRDGDESRAVDAMQRAAKAAPEVGATHLRLALWQFERSTPRAREAYAEANRLRASLDERDAELLRAAGSLFAQPWDLAAWSRDLAALSEKYPDDVELLLYLGYAEKARLSFDSAVSTFDRVLALDPELVPASLFKADVLSMKGDGSGQIATYRACVTKVPTAVGCQEELVLALGRAGKCDEMLVEAKRFASAHADLASAHEQLADALAATGAPEEAVTEALAKGLERQAPERRA
ncbi:MAG: protein kinase, partial [Myxococcales bacterium]|nr:protein kinase [Myxococcales bacterium]